MLKRILKILLIVLIILILVIAGYVVYVFASYHRAEDNITLEVNILNFSGDIYNNEITVQFIKHVRGDVKFNSLDELIAQLGRDREAVDKILTH